MNLFLFITIKKETFCCKSLKFYSFCLGMKCVWLPAECTAFLLILFTSGPPPPPTHSHTHPFPQSVMPPLSFHPDSVPGCVPQLGGKK